MGEIGLSPQGALPALTPAQRGAGGQQAQKGGAVGTAREGLSSLERFKKGIPFQEVA